MTDHKHGIMRLLCLPALLLAALFVSSCKHTLDLGEKLSEEEIAALREDYTTHLKTGKNLRNNADFSGAIEEHTTALGIAERLRDTLEMISCMNQLGTNYRRLGEMNEATSWHYKALDLFEDYSDTTSNVAVKCKVTALNGLGNILLTLGNTDGAENAFRKALAGEEMLESDLGQAINCANIGSIIEGRGNLDEAMEWYRRSMEHNRVAGSTLGISLCHSHFGRIAVKQGDRETAVMEYENAYDILKNQDPWHWLEPCFALADIYTRDGDWGRAYGYICDGLSTAKSINSLEHMARGYELMGRYYENRKDWRNALDCYKLGTAAEDSVTSQANQMHMQNLRIRHEQELHAHDVERLNREKRSQRAKTRYAVYSAILVTLLLITVIIFMAYALRLRKRTHEAMKKLEKTRQDFFTNVTHELRTPLTVILGMSDRLKRKYATDEVAEEDFNSVIEQGNNLLTIVNELLDIAKVKSSIGDPNWRSGNIDIMLQMIVDNMKVYGSQSLIDVHYATTCPGLEIDFVPDYVKKSVGNLISNAIKFTPRGGQVIVTLDKEGDYAKITVADTGNGIAPDDLPHVFETFYQGATPGRVSGSGIGLTMTRQMVEAMEGHIDVYSLVGSGTSFVVMLPVKHGESDYALWQPEAVKAATPIVQKKAVAGEDAPLVLLVEDNDDIAHYECSLLEEYYRVVHARNGQEGLEKALEYIPDLIVTDLMMPVMDGYEFCRKVRESIVINHIPVIVITARCTEEDRLEGLKAGANSFLTKPFNSDELLLICSNALAAKAALREKYSEAMREGKEETVELPEKDKEFLEKLNSYIYSNMADPDLGSDAVAQAMCLSQRQLSRKVKGVTGTDITSYIRKARMALARKLLLTTNVPVGEIVGKCGFDSASYFSKLYREEYGETPSKTRKMA